MTDLRSVIFLEPMRCLLQTQVLVAQCFGHDPSRGFNPIPGFLASVQSKLMSLPRSIASQSTIPSELIAGRGYMNLDHLRNLRLIVPGFAWSGSSTGAHTEGYAEGESGIVAEGRASCLQVLISAPRTCWGRPLTWPVQEEQILPQAASYPNPRSCTCDLKSMFHRMAE